MRMWLLALVTLCACGSSGAGSGADKASDLRPHFEQVLRDAATGDLDQLYSTADPELRAAVTRQELGAYLELRRKELGPVASVDWSAPLRRREVIREQDGVPTAWLTTEVRYSAGQGFRAPVVKLVKRDGAWRLRGLFIPLPELIVGAEPYLPLGLPDGTAEDALALMQPMVDDLVAGRLDALSHRMTTSQLAVAKTMVDRKTFDGIYDDERKSTRDRLVADQAPIGAVRRARIEPYHGRSVVQRYYQIGYLLDAERGPGRFSAELVFDRVDEVWRLGAWSLTPDRDGRWPR